MTKIIKFKNHMGDILGSYWNEAKFLMMGVFVLWCINKLIDLYTYLTGRVVGKWGYEYLGIEFYSLVRLGILMLGVKFIMALMMPNMNKHIEFNMNSLYNKLELSETEKWKTNIAWLVYFALLFGAIFLSNGQAQGLAQV